jgi:hypothetical protein
MNLITCRVLQRFTLMCLPIMTSPYLSEASLSVHRLPKFILGELVYVRLRTNPTPNLKLYLTVSVKDICHIYGVFQDIGRQ